MLSKVSSRSVEAEILDGLAPDDPRGVRSRRDLQRLHGIMRSVGILRRAIASLRLAHQPIRIVELGAGDGTLLLRLARSLRPAWRNVELTLVDQVDVVADRTRQLYGELGWTVRVIRRDALDWVASQHPFSYDLCIANLFLHHFHTAQLRQLLQGAAAASGALLACEPRRGIFSHLASQMVALVGANEVTRVDAVKSVAAGFVDHELTAAWACSDDDWRISEFPAWPFTHCLAAVRSGARAAEGGS